MTGYDGDRKVDPAWGKPIGAALASLLFLAAAASAPAQQGPVYYPPMNPPAAAMPNGPYPGYPTGPQQRIQPAQNIYYGNYQNNTVPGYIYPRNFPMPANTGYSGSGITYYYVNNPSGQNYYPFTSPYGTPPSYQAKHPTPTYPAPVNMPAVQPPYTPISDDLGDGRKPMVSFHREPNETSWVKGEVLGAFLRPLRLGSGPLATTGSALDASPGALGLPATSVLFGGPIDFGFYTGVKLQAGCFLDHDNHFSLDVVGFVIFPNAQNFSVMGDANGNPVIARPIFDVNRGADRVFLNSDPGNVTGALTIHSTSEMSGVEFNAGYHDYVRERLHFEALLGFRYLRLSERLQIHENVANVTPNFVTFLGNRIPDADSLADDDLFHTTNQFFGPQIGAHVTWEQKWFSAEAFAKLALGPSLEQTTIAGTTTLITANGNQTVNGGILALPSNIGDHDRTIFGIVPELGFNLGVELTQHMRLNFGYSFLMWNRVVRPGSQYDLNINPSQAPGSPTYGTSPGPTSPSYRFNDEFFWSHTFNLGLEVHY